MSDETKQVLEAAIEAHFANECDGAMVGGYMLQVFGSTVDDINDAGIRMLGEVPDTQNIVTTMGLADYARQNFSNRVFSWEADEDG
jgi:hypothetical protein